MYDSLKNPLSIGFSGIVYQSITFLKDKDIYRYIYFGFIDIDDKVKILYIYL